VFKSQLFPPFNVRRRHVFLGLNEVPASSDISKNDDAGTILILFLYVPTILMMTQLSAKVTPTLPADIVIIH